MIEIFYSMLTVLLQPVLEAVGGVWQWAIFMQANYLIFRSFFIQDILIPTHPPFAY